MAEGGQCGTYEYMAPEIVNGMQYTFQADIWSLGCILYELCTLSVPWTAKDMWGLQFQIMDANNHPKAIPKMYPNDL